MSTVVDMDAHYLEDLAEIANYVDEPWRSRLGEGGNLVGGNIKPNFVGDQFVGGRIRREEINYPESSMDPSDIETIMRHVGIDKAILVSNKLLGYGRISSPDRAVVLANGHMDYMLDQVVDPSRGIYTMVHAPYHDPEAAVRLIDRVKSEKGVIGVCLITPNATPVLGQKRYDIIYEAAEKAGLPLVLHGGSISMDNEYFRGFSRVIEGHTVGFLTNNIVHLTSMMVQGFPEKFSDLDVIWLECGVFWIPMMMYRLDAEYLKRPSEAPLLEKRPSEYMKEFYYGTQPIEDPESDEYLEQIFNMIGGTDRLMYASDYPHWDYDRPSSITDLSFLTEQEQHAILGGNAEEVFGI